MDLAMEFPFSNMAMIAENTPRPYPAELINTPDGPYIVGTGAPLQFFTSASFDKPAFVSTQLGTLERKSWPKSLLDLPRPFTHIDVRRKAKKVAIFFVEKFKINNVRHVRPPTSLQDLFQGFDAVGLYMYGIEFCHYIMYYIGKFAMEYQSKFNQKIDSHARSLVEINKKNLIRLPQADNSTEERILHPCRYKITERMNSMEKDFFWERIYHYRKIIFDEEKTNPLKRRLDPSFSDSWSCTNDNQTRSKKYEPNAPCDLKKRQTTNKSNSPSDLFTNPMCRMELENPSPEKYTQGSSFMIFRKCKDCKRNDKTKEMVIIITDSDIAEVDSKWSGIPRPKLSRPLSSERTLSSTRSKKGEPKLTFIPQVRSSDLILGKSKIPRLSSPKSHHAISCSRISRKQPVKETEPKERKKTVTAASRQSKNIRKPNLSAQSQNLMPLKPDKWKKTNVSVKVVESVKKAGHLSQRCQKKPWV